jgi:Mn-containing catalase
MFQSFNFHSKSKLRPFYSLVASITAEGLGHVELVSNGVAMLANGPDNDGDEADGGDISDAPFADMGASGSPRPSCPRAAVPPPLAATMRRGTTTS